MGKVGGAWLDMETIRRLHKGYSESSRSFWQWGGAFVLLYVLAIVEPMNDPKISHSFLYLMDLIQYTISFLLTRIGLNPSFEREPTPWENKELLFMSVGISMPSAKSPAQSVKEKLAVIEYQSFLKRKRKSTMAGSMPDCSICLQLVEPREHVRELGNCFHEFLVSCIYRWLHLRRLCYPLCRSAVVPPETCWFQFN
ncbi:NEP1-interacting protein 1-like [Phalaenopsis equestris]|uniref:NEP1-interacting protein 1-like n=1 Tax=Phalaenopsis equestris TaxID=78828 RepID=UPI0009E50443|nr:NEP1-interacting protein 1-like [Phalaenopsis equestris]